jgi:glycosyltransferase involved in cell wall biosynthesis
VSRAFLICPEPVRRLTAGVGSRFVGLAEVLVRSGHRVTLAIPNDPAEAAIGQPGLEVVQAEPDSLGRQAEGHDWVLLHGHLGNHYLCQRDDLPVVVDLYDPFLIENLHYHRELGLGPFRNDHATWRLQLSRGDFFLCSSSEQRLFYLGWLSALSRIHPQGVEQDPTLERLIVEVPFGCPATPPPVPPKRSEVLPGVEDDAPMLYFGGIYDWYDPLVVLDALPRWLDRDPRTTVVFVGHPHPELTPQSMAARTRTEAERRGWLGGAVRFATWRPSDQRFDLPLVSDVAVVTHRPGLETELSLRTRVVDVLWLGVPVVATAGGAMSDVVERVGAGMVVPPGDADALAAAVTVLLDDPERRAEAADAGRRWAASRTWDEVSQPLLAFAEAPWRDQARDDFRALAPGETVAREPFTDRVERRLRRLIRGRR